MSVDIPVLPLSSLLWKQSVRMRPGFDITVDDGVRLAHCSSAKRSFSFSLASFFLPFGYNFFLNPKDIAVPLVSGPDRFAFFLLSD